MIIYIAQTDIEELITFDSFNTFIELLMICYQEGKHLIAMTPRTLNKIIHTIESDTLLKKLKVYQNDYNSSSLSLLDHVSHVCQIKLNNENTIVEKKNIKFHYIGISHFIDSSIFQKTILLSENYSDCSFYKILGSYFLNYKKLTKHCIISAKSQGGGGSTIDKEYLSIHKDNNTFCLCISDSDIKFPNGPKGETSKKLLESISKVEKNAKLFTEILDVHEIENLIPRKFYLQEYEDKEKAKQGNFYKIDKLIHNNPNIYRYFDFKNGYNCLNKENSDKEIYSVKEFKESDKEVFWINEFINNEFYPDFDLKYIHGYGNSIMEKFNNSNNIQVFHPAPNDYTFSFWQSVGQLVFSFCIGTQRKLVG